MNHEIKQINTKQYKHIDNGGITLDIKSEAEIRTGEPNCLFGTSISFNMGYHGYPDITAVINLRSQQELKFIIDAITEHYYKVQTQLESK